MVFESIVCILVGAFVGFICGVLSVVFMLRRCSDEEEPDDLGYLEKVVEMKGE